MDDALIWDVAGQKLESTLPFGGNSRSRQLAISPDGKTLAVAWAPKAEESDEDEPDPLDLPQPRVSLAALEGKGPVRNLIAPHGYAGELAFSPDGRTLAFGGAGAVHLFDLTK